MDTQLMIAELKRDEGNRLQIYDDATGLAIKPGTTVKGHPTIGIGRALDVRGISQDEADLMLANDIAAFTLGLQQAYTWFSGLDDVRQRVLVNMAFNMGLAGLGQFHDTLRYIEERRWQLAADAMRESHWSTQTGERAARLCDAMATGEAQA